LFTLILILNSLVSEVTFRNPDLQVNALLAQVPAIAALASHVASWMDPW
jgi:hypothetical protein